MRSLFGKHQQQVSSLAKNVDTDLAGGRDPVHMLSELRDVLKGVVAKMEQDVDTLVSLSQKDSLTGLANRRSFDSFLDECVERWKKGRKNLGLVMFDIDHFKKFNDTYGHLVGDQVLRTLAAPVQNILKRLADHSSKVLAARYGGEEFAVLLSGKVAENSVQIGEQLRKAIQNTSLLLRDTEGKVLESGLRVTISVGVATIRSKWGGAYQANLVDCADKALYYAKNLGRNCTVAYTPDAADVYSLIPGV
jgi:diguanylate cyclase (GGDEF)-like protein